MAKVGRKGNPDYEMQQEIYGRIVYNETPQSAIDKEMTRIRHDKALEVYKHFAELAGVSYSWSINRDISNYLKDNIF